MVTDEMRTWAEIDMSILEHNYREIRSRLPERTKFCGVCKANAYGHGAVEIARKLKELGAEYIAVSCLSEAKELREAGIEGEILVLAPSPASAANELADLDLTQAIGDIENAIAISDELAASGKVLKCQLKLDSGMGRTGFNVLRRDAMYEAITALVQPNFMWSGAFTHSAMADEPKVQYTEGQFACFNRAVDEIERITGGIIPMRHCSNSGAVINFPDMAQDMVRPGLLLYGLYPGEDRGDIYVFPVMRLKTRIAAIHRHRAGDGISYGHSYVCDSDRVIAVLPIGYADGLPRAASGSFSVRVRGKKAPQVGRICMDMCMVDITDIEDAEVGDEVLVFGGGREVDNIAKAAGTIPHEILCSVSPRVPRVYVNNGVRWEDNPYFFAEQFKLIE